MILFHETYNGVTESYLLPSMPECRAANLGFTAVQSGQEVIEVPDRIPLSRATTFYGELLKLEASYDHEVTGILEGTLPGEPDDLRRARSRGDIVSGAIERLIALGVDDLARSESEAA
jgi:hypothetical protein